MPNYQTTVNRIKDIVVRKIPVDPAEASSLATDYAVIANEAVRRLDEIYEHINRGLRSEAIHLAETPPPLLDVLAALDFEGLDVWTSYTVSNNLPVPPSINSGRIQTLQEAYGKHEALEPMQKVYRRLSVKGGSTAEKISIVRRIRALDPANPNWPDDLKALEVARCKEIGELLRKPEGMTEDIAAEYVKELTDKQLLVIPGDQLITFAKEIHQRLKSARVHQAMENLINRLNIGTAANDYDQVGSALKELDELSKNEGVSIAPDKTAVVEDARYWHTEQKTQREQEVTFAADCQELRTLIQSAGDPAQVRQLLNKLGKRELPDDLRKKAESYVKARDNAVSLKKNLRLAAIGGGVLAGILLVLWIVVAISAGQKRSAIAAQIHRYTDTADFKGGQTFISSIGRDAPDLLDDGGIHREVLAFNQAKSDEGVRQKRLETDLELAGKLEEPFSPTLDTAISDANTLVRSDEEKARLAECRANVEAVRFKRKDENVKAARGLMSEVTEAYKAVQSTVTSDSLRERLVKMDDLLLRLEAYKGLKEETELVRTVQDFRKRYVDEKNRLEKVISKEDKERATLEKVQKDLFKACQKMPDLNAYAEEIAKLAESYGEIPETQGLQQWKIMAPSYKAVAEYGDAIKSVAGQESPSYVKYAAAVARVRPEIPISPYSDQLKLHRFRAAFHADYKNELADLFKVLNHDLLTKMNQFQMGGKIYYTANGESKLNVGDGKIQIKAFLDDTMKPKSLMPQEPGDVSDIVPARHCELASEVAKKLKASAEKMEWEQDFPTLVRDVLEYKDVNPWVHVLLLQKLTVLDKDKFCCLAIPAALQTEIDALSADKLNFWMTDDPSIQTELRKISERLAELTPKLKKHLESVIAGQPARVKAESIALTRPLCLSAVFMRDQKGNRVAHDIGGQSYREYWTLVMQDKIPYFRIAAAVGSDGSLVWYHPELLTLGQPLLSPVDAKMGTEELYDRYLKNSPVVPALWPTNIGDIKKSEKGL